MAYFGPLQKLALNSFPPWKICFSHHTNILLRFNWWSRSKYEISSIKLITQNYRILTTNHEIYRRKNYFFLCNRTLSIFVAVVAKCPVVWNGTNIIQTKNNCKRGERVKNHLSEVSGKCEREWVHGLHRVYTNILNAIRLYFHFNVLKIEIFATVNRVQFLLNQLLWQHKKETEIEHKNQKHN